MFHETKDIYFFSVQVSAIKKKTLLNRDAKIKQN